MLGEKEKNKKLTLGAVARGHVLGVLEREGRERAAGP